MLSPLRERSEGERRSLVPTPRQQDDKGLPPVNIHDDSATDDDDDEWNAALSDPRAGA